MPEDFTPTEELEVPADQKAANKLSLERAQIAQDIEDAREIHAEEVARADEWLADRTHGALERISRLDAVLQLWHQGHFDPDNATTNTVKLMGATLSTRKPTMSWDLLVDEDAVIAHLGDDHPAVKITKKVLVSKLEGDSLVSDDGEVLARKTAGVRKFRVEGLGDV